LYFKQLFNYKINTITRNRFFIHLFDKYAKIKEINIKTKTKKYMKKFIAKFLLILIILRTVMDFGLYEDSFAITNNWNFTVPANYTLSDATSMKIT
jgi:hypothetical protein